VESRDALDRVGGEPPERSIPKEDTISAKSSFSAFLRPQARDNRLRALQAREIGDTISAKSSFSAFLRPVYAVRLPYMQ